MTHAERVSLSMWQIETDIMLGRLDAASVIDAAKAIIEDIRDEAQDALDERDEYDKSNKELEDMFEEAERARSALAAEVRRLLEQMDGQHKKGVAALELYDPDLHRGESITDALKRAREPKIV